jgi:hypothetical protein
MNLIKTRILFISCLFFILFCFIGMAGCSTVGGITDVPLLPAGFSSTNIPDVSLSAYIYVNQGSPIAVSKDILPITIKQQITSDISVQYVQLWAGSDVNSIGGSVNVGNTSTAQNISKLISSYKLPVWSMVNGNVIYAANTDTGRWTASLKNALSQNIMINPSTKYADVAADFYNFPTNPDSNPFAAGYIDLNSGLVDSISAKSGVSLSQYISGLKSAGISRLCFVAYGLQNASISSKTLNVNYLNSFKSGVLVLGRSAYPDIALSLFFNDAMSNAGFKKYAADTIELYRYTTNGIEILIARNGNIIYAAAAQTKETAEKLILSCFK